jgi:hypothetical protein
MFSNKWVFIFMGGGAVCFACAQAEEQNAERGASGSAGRATGGVVGAAGKSASGGSISSQGGKSGAASGGLGGARAGAPNAGRAGSELDGAGESSGGTSGGGGGGVSGAGVAGSNAAGTSSAGSSTAGTSSTGAGCQMDAVAGATGEGGASALAAIFSADFEAGSAAAFTAALGTWTVIDDGSKVYEQSLLQNKLQMAVVNDVCATDQVIDARIKITDYGGASNSYSAALFGRVVSATTHYLLALGSDNKLALRKRVNGSGTSATAIGAAANLTFAEGTWYDVHLEIIGTTLKGCVGDVCVTGSDASIASGSVGLGTVNATARFDDVRVTSP